jgi:glycosyltransferase involved in cell wall biosynthesis
LEEEIDPKRQPVMITLAIPNRNGGRYLRETLGSLCSPSNRRFVSWWLQDCCSHDDSIQIAGEFSSSSDTIRIEADAGQANGLNRAFAKMGGEIVGHINSDDYLVDGAALAVCDAFSRHPDADIVFGQIDWIDKDSRVIGHHRGEITSLEDILDIYQFWWDKKQWVQPEVFYRRRLYEAVGGFDENLSLAFDFDFWVRVLRLRPKVVSIPQTLVRFRLHDRQRSRDFDRANDEIRCAVLRQLDDHSCPINSTLRARLNRKLQYDLYHTKSQLSSVRELSLWRALFKYPGWLLLPEVRERLFSSVQIGCQIPFGRSHDR